MNDRFEHRFSPGQIKGYARTDQRASDDCLVSCCAWFFGVPYEEVPQFVRDHGANWLEHWREWLRGRGYEVVGFDNHYPREGVYLADGFTESGSAHMTAWRGTDLIYDPDPKRTGLDNVRRTWWLMPILPAEPA